MISRRTLITATLAGIPVGVTSGLLFDSWLDAGSSVTFLGRGNAMLVLFDTGRTRALFLLGESDVALLEQLPQLLTMGKSRIDLLIGSHQWLTVDGIRKQVNFHRVTAIALQAHASLPPIRGNVVPIVTGQEIRLDNDCSIEIQLSPATTDHEPSDPGFFARIIYNKTQLVLANRMEAFTIVGESTTLFAVPGAVETGAIQALQPGLFVGTNVPAGYDEPAVQVHASEPTRISIKDGAVSLPRV